MAGSTEASRGHLYLAAVIVNIAAIAVGTHYTWSSPTIPQLEAADSWLEPGGISADQAAWIGSLTSLGSAVGPLLGGWLLDRTGRRTAVILSVVLSSVAWVLVLLSKNVWQIYIGRLLGGIAGGAVFVICPLYVAEISEVEVRGFLGPMFALLLVFGYVMQYVVGPFVSYSVLIFVNLVPAVVFFLLIFLVPESPYFYLSRGQTKRALNSLTWLRRGQSAENVQKELDVIEADVQSSLARRASWMEFFNSRGNRRGLLISIGLFTCQQLSGVNVILFYAETVFIMAGTSISSSLSTIVVGVILLVVRIFAAPLVRRFGSRNVLIASAIGMGIFQLCLGLFFYFKEIGAELSSYDWVPITTLVGYIIFLTVGYGPLPWAVMAELFTPDVKALATSFSASYNWLFTFLLARYFPIISTDLGPSVPFFFFAAGGALALVFTVLCVPDTRGLSLQQVTGMLNRKYEQNPKISEVTTNGLSGPKPEEEDSAVYNIS